MLDLQLGTALFQLVAFLVLVFLVSRFAVRPVSKMMEARTERIKSTLEEAEAKRKEALLYVEQQREALKQARQEAQGMLATARFQKEQEAASILQEARQRAEQTLESAKSEVAREREEAVRQLRVEVSGLAVQLASRILHKEVDRSQHEQLLERYLRQVGP
uniref:ATP synthase subunit b n=2 Tax=Pasteuria penetrans TaxID=86005 RepID=Q6RI16_PASPE|nr:ATP synthase B subunit [Pasteuria penetrans]